MTAVSVAAKPEEADVESFGITAHIGERILLAAEVAVVEGAEAARGCRRDRLEEIEDLGEDGRDHHVAPAERRTLVGREPMRGKRSGLVADEQPLAVRVMVDVLHGRDAWPARDRGLEAETRDAGFDDAGLAVVAERGQHADPVLGCEAILRVGREIERDAARPVGAEIDIAVDAAISDRDDPQRPRPRATVMIAATRSAAM